MNENKPQRLYENSFKSMGDEPYTVYKIAYTVGRQTRIMQVKAASPFLALKEFKRVMTPIVFESCLIETVEELPVVVKRNLKRNKLKTAV